MKKRFVAPMLLSAVFLVFCTLTQPAEAAYSDYSVYELETKQQLLLRTRRFKRQRN